MGLHIGFSSCTCDKQQPDVVYVRKEVKVLVDVNPNPSKFSIERSLSGFGWVLIDVRYEGCTNYEGRKILLYKDVYISDILLAEQLDPHFCDNEKCMSPFARFEPTDDGWNMGKMIMENNFKK